MRIFVLSVCAAAIALSCSDGASDSDPPDASAVAPDADTNCDREDMDEWFADTDGDGFGDIGTAMLACEQPPGFVANSDDCDDTTAARQPGGTEICDGLDNDCDDATAETCAAGCTGFAGTEAAYAICTTPATYLGALGTCNGMQLSLMRIDTLEENTEVRAEMTARAGAQLRFYAGGQDSVTEDTWVWEDGTQFWQGRANGMAVGGLFENWLGGEPNDDGTEDCLEVRENGRWNDLNCNNARAFACEVPPG